MKYLKQNPYYYIEGISAQFDAFAQAYGCGAYGAGEYDNNCETSTGGTDGSGSGTNGLVDTGFGIILAVTIAAVLIFATVLVMVMRRRKKQLAKPTASTAQRPVQSRSNTDIINSGKDN